MAAPVCTVSGTLTDTAGTARARALVRARVLDRGKGLVRDGVAVGIGTVTTVTDAAGAWSIALPQAARIRLEVPAAGVDHVGKLPDASTVAFDVLFPTMTPYRDGGRRGACQAFPTR